MCFYNFFLYIGIPLHPPFGQGIIWAFYGLNYDDFSVDVQKIDMYMNDTTASYLAVVGVLYSLVVAHLFACAQEKLRKIQDMVIFEVSSVRRIIQMVKSLDASTLGNMNSGAVVRHKCTFVCTLVFFCF